MTGSPRANVMPEALTAYARSATRDAFCAVFRGALLLVVRVEALAGELELGLVAAAERPAAAWRPRSGVTGVGTMMSPISDQFVSAAAAGLEQQRQLSSKKLQALFWTRQHYVMPLGKRSGSGPSERLTVGRSATNDVVLRHPSISKLHASLEWDEVGMHYVCDEGSTNSTQVNGRLLTTGEPAPFEPGDALRFGDVEAFVALPETFWDALTS